MKEKIAVYTCITGNYDELQEISKNVFENNIDYYCFTNNKNVKSNTWKVIYIEDFSLTNHMLNRKIKILGNELINDKYDILVWIDGNVVIKEKISKFLSEQCDLKNYSFCAFKHPDRNCIYDEGTACVRLKKDNKDIILKQLSFYEKDGYPRNNGLCEMGIFVRRNNDKIVQETMQLWYEMINKYSKRDQLSFMWCVKKRKLRLQVIPLTIDDNKYFLRINHYKNEEKITDYRLYFGDSSNFEIDKVVDGKYEKKDNNYVIKNIVVPVDTNRIEFYACSIGSVEFSNLKLNNNKIKNVTYYNSTTISNKTYFFNNSNVIIMEGQFIKNEKITISIELKIISAEDWIKIAHDEYEENNKLNLKLKEQEDTILKLSTDLNDIEKENDINKAKIQAIENSKGWKMLERLRKIKYRNK